MTDPATLEADIVRQREQLAHTVDALSHKLDVKEQASQRLSELKQSATTDSGRPRPAVVLTVVAVAGSVALLVWWRHQH